MLEPRRFSLLERVWSKQEKLQRESSKKIDRCSRRGIRIAVVVSWSHFEAVHNNGKVNTPTRYSTLSTPLADCWPMQRSMFLQRCYLGATGNYARKCRRCWIVVVFWPTLYVSVDCIGVLHVNTYIDTHAHAKIQRRTGISSLPVLVPLASPSLQLVQDLREEGTIFGCQVPPISFMRPAWLSKVVKGLLIRRNDFSQRILFAANIIPAKSYLPPTLFLGF